MTSRRRVLVVDDYADAAETAALLLTALGHDCRVAYDGASAVALAAAFEPDVTILDLRLPDVSGYELARQLRDEHPDMVIAALTGWTRATCDAELFDHLAIKPASRAKLEEIVALAPHEGRRTVH